MKEKFWLLLIFVGFQSLLLSCSSLNKHAKNSNEQIVKDISDARALYEMGEIQAAISTLGRVVERPYKSAQNTAYELLVEWLLEINNYAEAKHYASLFMQQHPKSPSAKKIAQLFKSHAVHEKIVEPPPPVKDNPSDLEVDKAQEKEIEIEIDLEKKKSSFHKEPIKKLDPHALGILLPLSGTLAPFGKKALQAIALALDIRVPLNLEKKITKIEALGLKIFIADSEGDVKKTQIMVGNLIDQHHVALILGDISNDASLIAAQICQQQQVVLLSLSRHPLIADLGDYIFMFNPSYNQQINFLIEYARKTKSYERFAILYPRHNYGITMAKAFYDAVIKSGGEISAIVAYDAHETTFTTAINDLAGITCVGKQCTPQSAMPKIDFEALFIPEFTKLAYLIPALVQADLLVSNSPQALKNYILATKIKKPMPVQLLGLSSWSDKATLQKIGDQANGAFFVDVVSFDESAELINFKETWDNLNQGAPTATEVLAYDATKMVLKILNQERASRENIRVAVSKFNQRAGLLKNIKFSPEGELITQSVGLSVAHGSSSVIKQ